MITESEIQSKLPFRLARYSKQFFLASQAYDLDPFIIAAIIDRESLGGDAIGGAAGSGDGGHGRGLGQIDDRWHKSFIDAEGPDGIPLWKRPLWNILFAANTLFNNYHDAHQDINVAIAAYNCGMTHANVAVNGLIDETSRIMALDAVTTGGNYLTDVLRRYKLFIAPRN